MTGTVEFDPAGENYLSAIDGRQYVSCLSCGEWRTCILGEYMQHTLINFKSQHTFINLILLYVLCAGKQTWHSVPPPEMKKQ